MPNSGIYYCENPWHSTHAPNLAAPQPSDERAAFEKWFDACHEYPAGDDWYATENRYFHCTVASDCWLAWQARASLERRK